MKSLKQLIEICFLTSLLAFSFGEADTAIADPAIIWDTMVKDDDKFYAFDDSLAWANKASWVQVPYGTTDYNFIGSAVVENGNFWLYLHETHSDSPFLYANVDGVPGTVAELYGYYNPKLFTRLFF
jgi:uncharacterized protein involved in type VI secretion and phage assembly